MLKFLHAKSHNVTADFSYINWHALKLNVTSPQSLGALTPKEANESPRVCQRLNNLRNWNYEKIKSLYIRIS